MIGFFAVLAALCPSTVIARSSAIDGILRHVTLVEVEKGRAWRDRAVVWWGGTIFAVGPGARIPRRSRAGPVVDGSRRYPIPSLWEMHGHIGDGPDMIEESKARPTFYIVYCVTTIRDCWGDLPDQVLAWREAIARDALLSVQPSRPQRHARRKARNVDDKKLQVPVSVI